MRCLCAGESRANTDVLSTDLNVDFGNAAESDMLLDGVGHLGISVL